MTMNSRIVLTLALMLFVASSIHSFSLTSLWSWKKSSLLWVKGCLLSRDESLCQNVVGLGSNGNGNGNGDNNNGNGNGNGNGNVDNNNGNGNGDNNEGNGDNNEGNGNGSDGNNGSGNGPSTSPTTTSTTEMSTSQPTKPPGPVKPQKCPKPDEITLGHIFNVATPDNRVLDERFVKNICKLDSFRCKTDSDCGTEGERSCCKVKGKPRHLLDSMDDMTLDNSAELLFSEYPFGDPRNAKQLKHAEEENPDEKAKKFCKLCIFKAHDRV